MAIQPQARVPSAVTQTLRFVGTVVKDTAALAVYPKLNGTLPSDAVSTETWGARFLLADATDPTDTTTTLPYYVYDDSTPAAVAPHAATTGAIAKMLTATDEIIGAPNAAATNRSWCNNVDIQVYQAGIPTSPAGNSAITVFPGAAYIVLDTLTSGLGLNTGLPVLVLPVAVTNATTGNMAVELNMQITIRPTASR